MKELIKPWEATIGKEQVRLFPNEIALEAYKKRYSYVVKRMGLVVCKLFWDNPEQDHLHTYVDDEQTVTYGAEELVTWVSGVALSRERQRILNLSNSQNGSFDDTLGWRPMTVIKTLPTPDEQERFISWEASTIDEDWISWEG